MPTNKQDDRQTSGQKSIQGGRGNTRRASPATVERYLKGIKYPANKQTLLNQAKNNQAPNDVMNIIQSFGDKDYQTTIDVAKEMSKVEA